MQVTPLHILLLGIVIYVAYRILSARKKAGKDKRAGPLVSPHEEEKRKQAIDAYKIAENTWDRLRSKPPETRPTDATLRNANGLKADDATPLDTTSPKTADISLPENFDLEEFLAGATAMYARITESWNMRDMEDLKQFTTAEFFEDLKRRALEETRPASPEVPPVSASLAELTVQGDKTLATVFYDAAPTEDTAVQQSQSREVWRFVQDNSIPGSSWLLENIQQIQ
ncbi:MAG: TIM44-like domain-containing protein [Thermodesulfobacteriota bacterium]|nr:TIM44-like domain-containing protein [Thermodesulfobacteriota bacterium]